MALSGLVGRTDAGRRARSGRLRPRCRLSRATHVPGAARWRPTRPPHRPGAWSGGRLKWAKLGVRSGSRGAARPCGADLRAAGPGPAASGFGRPRPAPLPPFTRHPCAGRCAVAADTSAPQTGSVDRREAEMGQARRPVWQPWRCPALWGGPAGRRARSPPAPAGPAAAFHAPPMCRALRGGGRHVRPTDRERGPAGG
jgi:hypothetical protein